MTNSGDGPFWCPYCEAIIVLDGEIATKEADAYWHTYDHQDVAPYAFQVFEEFTQLSTVETEQKPDDGPGLGTVDGGP